MLLNELSNREASVHRRFIFHPIKVRISASSVLLDNNIRGQSGFATPIEGEFEQYPREEGGVSSASVAILQYFDHGAR